MKKASTYYFCALTGLCVVLGLCVSFYTQMIEKSLNYALVGQPIPEITECFFTYYFWPYVFAGFSFIGTIISIVSRFKSSTLCHYVIAFWATLAFVLFFSIIAYSIPFVVINGPLGVN